MSQHLFSASPAAAARWPEGGLETVPVCPVCGSADRELNHSGLRDRLFGCAPGEWSLYRCSACGAGYLNPRPNAETISLAYSRYTTHGAAAGDDPSALPARRKRRLARRDAYLAAHHGYPLAPGNAANLRWLSRNRRRRFEESVAYLRYPGKGARLLDIGCGNGRFLRHMRALGWEVCGVEPDPKATAEAIAAGLDVRAGVLDSVSLPADSFDAITLNHVIEHVPRPVETLGQCLRVLKPGGTISILTPNFESEGHRLFGSNWFPLEAPRHLVLFTAGSLRRALASAGFEPEPTVRLRLAAQEMFRRSFMHLRRGDRPIRDQFTLPWHTELRARFVALLADRKVRDQPELAEELALLARKPGSA